MDAAADHVHDLDLAPRQLRRLTHRATVGQGQGVVDAAHVLPDAAGPGLIGCPGGVVDAGGHVPGGVEGGVVDIDHGAQRLGGGRGGVELGQGDLHALALPGAHGLIEDPQAHDVLQVADRVVHAELVGEVGGLRGQGEHRLVQLQADQ